MRYQNILFVFISLFILSCGSSGDDPANNGDYTYEFSERYELKSVKNHFGEEKIPMDTLQFPAAMDTQVVLESGSYVNIPQNAFLDPEGNVYEGMVDFQYREFSDPTEFFASGIPMALDGDENGIDIFESAGMMEIKAFAGDQELSPNPENPVEIGIASNKRENYPMWKFDEGKGWTQEEDATEIKKEDMDTIANRDIPPVPRPDRVVGNSYRITPELCADKPHLQPYENWEFIPIDPMCDQGTNIAYCKDIKVDKIGGGKYKLTIEKWTRQVLECECKRYQGESGYLKKYQAYMEKYRDYMRYQRIIKESQYKMAQSGNDILRQFTPAEFGVFNCDQATHIEYDNYTYEYVGYDQLDLLMYCIDFTRTAKYPCVYGDRIGIVPENTYAVFAITEEEKILYSSISDCKKVFKNNHFTFDFQEMDKSIPMSQIMTLLKK